MHNEKRYFFIINPTAKNGQAVAVWQQLQLFLDLQRVSFQFAMSKDIADVEKLAKAAAAAGAIVVGVGGDGTLSRIAGALAGTKTTFGLIPAGTGNDFARTYQIPDRPEAAMQIILNGYTIALDLGMVNGRYFYNAVGSGLDAEVVADANLTFKRIGGSFGYLLALLRQLILYRPQKIKITVNDEVHVVEAWLVTVANACYFGSGMKIAPCANPQDGLLDVIVVQGIHRLNFLRLFPRVYRGQHIKHPAVRVWQGTKIAVESEKPLAVQVDGDLCGQTPLLVTMQAAMVQLLVPDQHKTSCS
ncbi:MAG TPA: diacylglycerol kinase family protein [Oscillospiraceae bacterium]|nr:diacylglycerol kinase family protein [Oscillospiraceae bacterium]